MKVESRLNFISKNFLRIVFGIVLLMALLCKAMYSEKTKLPFFTTNKWYDYCMFLIMIIVFFVIFAYREWLQKKITWKEGFVLFIIISILYIFLVPSMSNYDSENIVNGAISLSNFNKHRLLIDWYWHIYPENISTSIFWGILLLPFPKTLITLKILNALFMYGIIYFIRGLCKQYKMKYYNVIYLILICFIPFIMYESYVSYDIPVLFLCVWAVYLYETSKRIRIPLLILTGASCLHRSAFIVMAVLGIVYILRLKERNFIVKVNILKLICSFLVFLFAMIVLPFMEKQFFSVHESTNSSICRSIYIGANQSTLGMNSRDYTKNYSVRDIIKKIQTSGKKNTIKLYGKKTIWAWTQGTYLSEKYLLGENTKSYSDKFEYPTVVTQRLLNQNQKLYKLLVSAMRAQYILLLGLMIITLFKKKQMNDLKIHYYILSIMVLLLVVFDLNSRYILICLPSMAVLACQSFEYIEGRVKVLKLKLRRK